VGKHKSTYHRETLRASTDVPNVTFDELVKMYTVLRSGLRYWYGATEGAVYYSKVDFFAPAPYGTGTGDCNTACNGSQCDICFENAPTASGACARPGAWSSYFTMYIDRGSWAEPGDLGARVLAHEMGHCRALVTQPTIARGFHLPDENTHGGPAWCGHSIMGDHTSSTYNMCTILNHARNGGSPAPVPNDGSNWDWLQARGAVDFWYLETPDNYSYGDHDFYPEFTVTFR
jgi:hypothetical protein